MSIAAKIAAISDLIEPLAKTTRNNEARFNYVSIDDFYEQVAPIVRANGLVWTVTEEDKPELILHPDLSEPLVRYTYGFTLYDIDNSDDVLTTRMSIMHPLQGAQTTGSAASYAEKIYLRTLFKIVTGEPDADAFAQPRAKKRIAANDNADAFMGDSDNGIDVSVARVANTNNAAPPISEVPPANSAPKPRAKPQAPAKPQPEADVADDKPSFKKKADALIAALNIAAQKDLAAVRVWRLDAGNVAVIGEIKANSKPDFERINERYNEVLKSFEQKDKAKNA